ncbi:MAG TPA: hypothetical protein VJA82_08490 [Sediminibacterium sp.]|uniref:Uncharacterized protein n=1 Tax=Candidatus Nomurabacteria bacterium RIFOXYC2_FULL_36_19 TaxID=1801806 RepID=A0A1F6YWW1_9BACT|nr:hypothetical protein [Sediminibacterium sp.]OGJ10823.1 MAG: hypothetical protein A2456_02240 [Candidatus Nomurabacteria bacterium RIFOXYC2_FULL_36_19]OGJ13626.1 MAG: hypothetical protein A2554_03775 [Candidatus Nomurabacteria bacterium RIFOXYD2_FULL_35_12]HLD53328.1 hypothetical protein [Sediminibacterium sp.]
MEYINYHIQPLLGLIIGIVIVTVSGYLHWKIDKKVKAEASLSLENRSMSNDALKVLSSMGLAVGGIMIIITIKFLSSSNF